MKHIPITLKTYTLSLVKYTKLNTRMTSVSPAHNKTPTLSTEYTDFNPLLVDTLAAIELSVTQEKELATLNFPQLLFKRLQDFQRHFKYHLSSFAPCQKLFITLWNSNKLCTLPRLIMITSSKGRVVMRGQLVSHVPALQSSGKEGIECIYKTSTLTIDYLYELLIQSTS